MVPISSESSALSEPMTHGIFSEELLQVFKLLPDDKEKAFQHFRKYHLTPPRSTAGKIQSSNITS